MFNFNIFLWETWWIHATLELAFSFPKVVAETVLFVDLVVNKHKTNTHGRQQMQRRERRLGAPTA